MVIFEKNIPVIVNIFNSLILFFPDVEATNAMFEMLLVMTVEDGLYSSFV